MSKEPDAVKVVLAWHDAVNAGDLERLLELSSEDVEVGGPRGTGHGRELLREWFGRAGITLAPQRVFERGDRVIVEQRATWTAGGEGQLVASAFDVADGVVCRVVRFENLAAAGIEG